MRQKRQAKGFKLTAKIKVYREAWRVAAVKGLVEIPCETAAEAYTERFTLYNAVRDVRAGECKEEKLCEAVANCSVSIEKIEQELGETLIRVIIRRYDSDAKLKALSEALGVGLGEIVEAKGTPVSVEPPQVEERKEPLNRVQASGEELLKRINSGDY